MSDGNNKESSSPSRLQLELAGKILQHIKTSGFGVGHHLVETDLCKHFSVSRSPIRGALNLMAEKGLLEHRSNRGFAISRPLNAVNSKIFEAPEEEDDKLLFIAIAQARLERRIPETCTQQELVRMFNTGISVVVRVLRQLSELGLVERKPGNGWSFLPSIDTAQTQLESYQFRLAIEPEALLQKSFKLPRPWISKMRQLHESFRELTWHDTLAIEFFEMNADFHQGLASASGNRYFAASMERQNNLRRFLNYNWDFGIERVHESIDEHIEILDALEQDDKELAAVLMRRHLMCAENSPGGLVSDEPDPTEIPVTRAGKRK